MTNRASKEISIEEVNHIAHLTNLTLTVEETKKLSQMLTDTLEYVDILNELDTSQVTETFQVTGLQNVYRGEDFPETGLSQEEALQNTENSHNGKFCTDAVFDR